MMSNTAEATLVSRKVVLHFPRQLVDQPIVCNMVKKYDLEFNILRAKVTQDEEGLLVLGLRGAEGAVDEAMQYLSDLGVKVQALAQDIVLNEARCTNCGACVVICPTGALALDPATRQVNFYNEKCILCELCIKACPPRAMEVHF
jgi:ferredoxin